MPSSDQNSTDHEKASNAEHEITVIGTSLPPTDPAAVKRLLRNCDLHVVPPLFLLFLMAFLDRTNIGNARIQGLEDSLGMKSNDFDIALFVFFIPYILLEVPSNIIIKRIAPSTWLSGIMLFWGIATICQGLVTSFAGLVACRFLVGLFEAGLFPGNTFMAIFFP
ncbi:putative transporter [Lachnellula subtilissima]|uniref:Putative transporter n=1 Tax=Lachnellula subtilissima TaxID=602034 RepID=A0A8H8RR02_9HELO|nr:putative transporter [Lachnellula subtilissima]